MGGGDKNRENKQVSKLLSDYRRGIMNREGRGEEERTGKFNLNLNQLYLK